MCYWIILRYRWLPLRCCAAVAEIAINSKAHGYVNSTRSRFDWRSAPRHIALLGAGTQPSCLLLFRTLLAPLLIRHEPSPCSAHCPLSDCYTFRRQWVLFQHVNELFDAWEASEVSKWSGRAAAVGLGRSFDYIAKVLIKAIRRALFENFFYFFENFFK